MRVFCLFCFALLFAATTQAQTINKGQTDGQIYVKYIDEYPTENKTADATVPVLHGLTAEFSTQYGIYKITRPFITAQNRKLHQTFQVYFKNPASINELIAALGKIGFIEYAEPVPYNTTGYQPNDLGNNSGNGQYGLWITKAREAWDISKGDSNITVAIVDDGVSMFHPDLFNNIWRNPKEIAGNGIDDDNNGYIDDIYGYDVGDNDNDPVHPNTNFTHGTHVGGIAGAVTDNNLGVASMGFNISIIPVKCTFNGQSSPTSIPMGFEGVNYAANAGADIINCSWSSPQFSQTAQNVINYAVSKGCIVVAAASNDGVEQIRYPAAYNGVIAVASTDDSDTKSGFSNYGTWVDVSAPGSAIRSTIAQSNGYTGFSGTSMATPMVAGLLGLMKSHNPNLTNAQLEQCLLDSADDIYWKNPSYTGKLGSGRINAFRSLKCVDSLLSARPQASIQSTSSIGCPGVEVRFHGSSTKGEANNYTWSFPGGIPATSTSKTPIVSYINVGKYDVKLVVSNSYGADSITLTDYIEVAAKGREVVYGQNFETGTLSNMGFTVINPDNSSTWGLVNVSAAQSGTRALRLPYFSYSQVGQRDGLVTPVFSLSNHQGANLSFKHAYRARSITKRDSVIVYASIDSGKTFPYRIATFAENGTLNFATKAVLSSSFSPSNPTDWCYSTLGNAACADVDLSILDGEQYVALKFEGYNDNGNNIYIDDISVTAFCSGYNTVKPKSMFANDDTAFCLPKTINFSDVSDNFPTTRQWIFEGGNPAASTDKKPQVTYTTAGQFAVTLITSNAFGSDTIKLTQFIEANDAPTITVTATDTVLCRGKSTTMIAKGAQDYIWGPVFGISSTIGDTVLANPPSNVTYNIKGTSANGCTNTTSIFIRILPGPSATTISKLADTLVAANANPTIAYQWLFNGSEINGAETNKYRPTQTGNYSVRVTDSLGCQASSASYYFSTIGIKDVNGSTVKIYPNPASGSLYISGIDKQAPTTVTITDVLGRIAQETLLNGESIDISGLTTGLYFVTIRQNGQAVTQKIRVE